MTDKALAWLSSHDRIRVAVRPDVLDHKCALLVDERTTVVYERLGQNVPVGWDP